MKQKQTKGNIYTKKLRQITNPVQMYLKLNPSILKENEYTEISYQNEEESKIYCFFLEIFFF